MDVILDTNIYRQDPSARSGRFDVLLDYTEKTLSDILLPTIVRDELLGGLIREVRERQSKIASAVKDIARLLPHRPSGVNPEAFDAADEAAKYLAYLMARLRMHPTHVIDYKESYLRDAMDRAIKRRRPCSDSGEEIRDAILWMTVLDAAAARRDKAIAFISANTKQFADSAGLLHPDLLEDCAARDVTVQYFTSLDNFLRDHATRVAFATAEWVAREIDPTAVAEQAEDRVLDLGERVLSRKLDGGESIVSRGQILDWDLDDPVIYVYEMADGSFRVDITYAGRFELEFPIEVELYFGDEEYSYSVTQTKRRIEIFCNVQVDAATHDQRVVEWTLNGLELA